MPTPVVVCDNVVKIYAMPDGQAAVVALQGLDLEVQRGELVAIVGRSGSGKTTLLNVLGALDLPSAGHCAVAGYTLTRLSERQLTGYRRFVVGHVWQQNGRNLVPDLTLEENIGLPQLLAGADTARRRKRSAELLEMVRLGAMRRRRPDQLSGGEQQRAAIAVALANGPVLLLADEPTGELDSKSATECVGLLRGLTRELGLTVVLVTHDPAVAAVADRTIAIRDGRTSTETKRREPPLQDSDPNPHVLHREGSDAIGSHANARRESLLVDRAGRLQLPEETLQRVAFAGRAELLIQSDHVDLWPAEVARSLVRDGRASSRGTGLAASTYRETVVIDRVGRLQLSEEALDRIPFGRHATVQTFDDHVELWPAAGPASSVD